MDVLLQQIMHSLGAQVVDGDYRAPCPVCQPDATDPRRFKMAVNPGRQQLVICRCFICCDQPGYSHGEWWKTVRKKAGLPIGATGSLPFAVIEQKWATANRHVESEAPTADTYALNKVYTAVLNRLTLADRHRRWLERRGLPADTAFNLLYRSTPADSDAVAARVVAEWPLIVDTVPGWWRGRFLFRQDAVLIPCRNASGEVIALKQRLLDGKKGRMRLLSSAPFGGPKALNQCHCPLGVGGQKHKRLWITEGERKADVFWIRRREPIISIPGIGAWRQAMWTVNDLVDPGAAVVIALDQDEAGRRAGVQLEQSLIRGGYEVHRATWDGAKGVDDAVTLGLEISLDLVSEAEPKEFLPNVSQRQTDHIRDDDIVQWLRQRGPILRSTMRVYQPTVSKLIRMGLVRIREYTAKGQIVEAV